MSNARDPLDFLRDYTDQSKSAKFWLDPDVSLAGNYGYSRKELRSIERIARENLERVRDEWDAFCGGEPGAA
jgi:hypothetical protein